MKVILKDDVESLGEKGDIVKVKGGHARNYLIPRGLALEATPGNIKSLEAEKKHQARKIEKEIEAANAVLKKIDGAELKLKVKAGEGKLYGAVTTKDIAELVSKEKGVELDKKKVMLKDNIKTLGKYEIAIKLHKEVEAKITVEVEGEKEKTAKGETGGGKGEKDE